MRKHAIPNCVLTDCCHKKIIMKLWVYRVCLCFQIWTYTIKTIITRFLANRGSNAPDKSLTENIETTILGLN